MVNYLHISAAKIQILVLKRLDSTFRPFLVFDCALLSNDSKNNYETCTLKTKIIIMCQADLWLETFIAIRICSEKFCLVNGEEFCLVSGEEFIIF